jgi:hypothetical protein
MLQGEAQLVCANLHKGASIIRPERRPTDSFGVPRKVVRTDGGS